MALIQCNECKHDVSTKADKCPNCGAPPLIFNPPAAENNPSVVNNLPPKSNGLSTSSIVIICFVGILILGSLVGEKNTNKRSSHTTSSQKRPTSSVDSAFKLCQAIDISGVAAEPCQVSGFNSSITISLDMTSIEARKSCIQIPNYLKGRYKLNFDSGWRFIIKSPYSNGNPIATCKL